VIFYQKALEFEKQNARLFNDLGKAFYHLGETESAIKSFENTLKIKPVFPDALNNYGVALIKVKKYKEAAGKIQLAIKQQPDFAQAHSNLGIVYFI
jgi:Tfp pilus assembly protein PilF